MSFCSVQNPPILQKQTAQQTLSLRMHHQIHPQQILAANPLVGIKMNSLIRQNILILILLIIFSPFVWAQKSTSQIEKEASVAAHNKAWQTAVDLLNPNTDIISPRSFIILATAYHEQNDFTNLVRVLKLLADKKPKDALVHYALGDAQLKLAEQLKEMNDKQQSESEAINSLRQSLRLRRDFRPTHLALVNYFLKVGMSHDAREQLNDMLKVFGERGDIHADLCRLHSADGFMAQAIKHCRRAISITPNDPTSYLYLAQTYFDQKNFEEAKKTLVHAAQRFPNDEFVQYGAGQFFISNGNFPVAVKYLTKAVGNNPNSARSQIGLAKSLFETAKTNEALSHFIRACQIDGSTQGEFLAAATKLRLKGDPNFSAKYSQLANGCKR
jgi:tetratricopeptide (TPR) repeat protein